MAILPQDEAAAILNHYLGQLARAAGLRWSERNQSDIERAAQLLCQADAPGDEIPPYQPIMSDRRTVVLDRDDYGDARFGQWRAQRRTNGDEEATQRMLNRERGVRR